MTLTLPSPETVARAFARGLRAQVGAIAYRRIIATIRDNPTDPTCPSHDYCDANIIMDEAMRAAGVPASMMDADFLNCDNPTESAVTALWNAAWDRFHADARA
jgi:hypothetical protein